MVQKYLDKYRKLPKQVKASLWFLICSMLQKGISVLTTPIFTRLLSPTEYGHYNVFISWSEILAIFISLRLAYGVYTRGLVKYEKDSAVFSSSLQGLSLVLCLFFTVVYLIAHDFWNSVFELTTVQMLCMLVMIWATAAFQFWAAEQRVNFQYRKLVLITIIVSLLKPIVGIIMVTHAEDKVTARILGLALVELIGYIGLFIVQMWRGKKFYSAKYWKYALVFNIPLLPHYLSQNVLNSADRIMIKYMIGPAESGIYSLAYSISKIMVLFNQALQNTLMPWIYKKIKANRVKDIAQIVYVSLMIIAGVNIFLIAFAPEAVFVFAPKTYHNAIWMIPPVAMSVFFMFSYNMFANVEFYYEKTNFIMTASVAGAVLNLILNYFCIRIFGYYAAAYTTLVCYMVYAIGHYLFSCKVCDDYMDGKRIYDTKILVTISGVFLVIGFAYLFSYNSIYIRYGITAVLLCFLLYKRNDIKKSVTSILYIRKER